MTLHNSGRAEEIVQETRLFDETKLETFSMRTKEGAYPSAACSGYPLMCAPIKEQEVSLFALSRSGGLQVLPRA